MLRRLCLACLAFIPSSIFYIVFDDTKWIRGYYAKRNLTFRSVVESSLEALEVKIIMKAIRL